MPNGSLSQAPRAQAPSPFLFSLLVLPTSPSLLTVMGM